MTTPARDGRDKPFCDWLRKHPGLDSIQQGLYAADIDMTLFKFKTFVDRNGTRDVKLVMDVEIKANGAIPQPEQKELLFVREQLAESGQLHKFCWSTYLKRKIRVWSLGQFLLIIHGGERPDDCRGLWWCYFKDRTSIRWQAVSEEQLVRILRFELHPRTLKPLKLRRHHKTQAIRQVVDRGLFEDEIVVIKRS